MQRDRTHKKPICPLVLLFALPWLQALEAKAEILISRSGDDLQVEITVPLTFDFIASHSDDLYGLLVSDVYAVDNTDQASTFDNASTSTFTIDGESTSEVLILVQSDFLLGAIDRRDLYFFYDFVPLVMVGPGDSAEAGTGTVIGESIFLDADMLLPDAPGVREVFLIDNNGNRLTNSLLVNVQVVPEPSAAFLGFLSSVGFSCYRRRA